MPVRQATQTPHAMINRAGGSCCPAENRKRGRVVATGPHDRLLEISPLYRELAAHQLLAPGTPGVGTLMSAG